MDKKMTSKIDICAVCAWRADCQKKFSISGKNIRCPDFTRDVSIKGEKDNMDINSSNKEHDQKV